MADAPKYPDFSQPSIMNPQYGPYVAKLLGPLIREMQRQQQFAGAFGVSPRQAIKPTPEEMQRALNVGLAFGGADITKEQREAWEKENAEFRSKVARPTERSWPESSGPTSRETFTPGTRVYISPSKEFRKIGDPFAKGLENFNGVVIDPSKELLADKMGWDPLKAEKQYLTPPSPDHVAVKFENTANRGGWWFWRHRNDLEVLPPKPKFNHGDAVEFYWQERDQEPVFHGMVTKPPAGYEKSPGPDYVWVDVPPGQVEHGGKPGRGQGPADEKIYPSGGFGSWFDTGYLRKKGK